MTATAHKLLFSAARRFDWPDAPQMAESGRSHKDAHEDAQLHWCSACAVCVERRFPHGSSPCHALRKRGFQSPSICGAGAFPTAAALAFLAGAAFASLCLELAQPMAVIRVRETPLISFSSVRLETSDVVRPSEPPFCTDPFLLTRLEPRAGDANMLGVVSVSYVSSG